MRLLIIQIPCCNEEATLGITLAALPREADGFARVEWLVVDDGSTDETVATAWANGVDHVVRLVGNQGLARAFMAGLENALRLGADAILNLDADNQYHAADIPVPLAPIREGRAGMVVGARPIGETAHFSPVKKTLQRLGSWAVRRASRTDVRDAPSGFRAFSRDAEPWRRGAAFLGLAAVDRRLGPALGRLAVASLGLFACAHLLLFRLHLPNRYTEPVLRAVLPVLGAILLVLVGGELLRRARQVGTAPVARGLWAAVLLAFTLGAGNWIIGDSFARRGFPKSFFTDAPQPELYRFLRAQPVSVRVATLTDEARFIPSFACRGVLSGRDYAIPYHLGFYRPLRERTRALLAVHYTEDPSQLLDFAAAHGITHFLVAHAGPDGEDRSLETNRWLQTFQPEQAAARAQVRAQRAAGRRGVLARLAATVPVFRSAEYALVSVADVRRMTDNQ